MSYFYAAVLLPDGTPSNVDFGGSYSETVAARVALRVSNQLQRDTCVVEQYRDTTTVRQVVRWKGLAVAEPVVSEPVSDDNRKTLSRVGLVDALYAARSWCEAGFTVTISPAVGGENSFNVIARK